MHQLHLGEIRHRNRSLRQGAEPFQILGCQFVARPDGGCGGHGIEIVEIHDAGSGLVMIAAHESFSQLPGTLSHVVGTGAVAHNVPKIYHYIKRRRRRERSVKRFEIGVDVAEQQYAHESPDKLPIIDWIQKIWRLPPSWLANSPPGSAPSGWPRSRPAAGIRAHIPKSEIRSVARNCSLPA